MAGSPSASPRSAIRRDAAEEKLQVRSPDEIDSAATTRTPSAAEASDAGCEEVGLKESEPQLPQATTPRAEVQEEAQRHEDPKAGKVSMLMFSDYPVVKAQAKARNWKIVRADVKDMARAEERANGCNVHWIDTAIVEGWLPKIQPWMRINHFPGVNNSLARKTRLARNTQRMQRTFPADFKFVPPTWVLPDDMPDLERRFAGPESKCIYIVKPDHLCQGKGIFLTNELEKLKQVTADARAKDQAVVVQRYLSRPMLIDGLKFDLRLYFLICGVLEEGGNIEPRCYLFNDGLVRLCTTPYEAPTPETLHDKCMHLTNYAVNKSNKDFQQPEDVTGSSASKRSLRWFMGYIEEKFGPAERRKLWHKLMGLCVKMLMMVQPTLEAEYHGIFPKDLTGGKMECRSFELLGIDVMLDEKRKPYLIEVNHLPSFATDSPLDEDIKSRLLEQVLDLTCAGLSKQDKRNYEASAKERREAAAAKPGSKTGGASVPMQEATDGASISPPTMMDLAVYKDFERAYPPPEGAGRSLQRCPEILARVRELFRPVNARSTRLPKDRPGSGGGDARHGRPPAAPGRTQAPSPRGEPLPVKRSRSVGPPRCAMLPPIYKRKWDNDKEPAMARKAEERRCQSLPPRVCLQLKSASIGGIGLGF